MAARAITSRDINALTGRTYPELEPKAPSLLLRLRTWYERNRQYRRTVAELGRLSDDVLADIGIGRHEIVDVARTLTRKAA
jgi:uncharacterized protein YjiS (DUF1127 family)